ncbi:MAG: hypothetical protein WCG77_11355 [Actinomycetes bacterium]
MKRLVLADRDSLGRHRIAQLGALLLSEGPNLSLHRGSELLATSKGVAHERTEPGEVEHHQDRPQTAPADEAHDELERDDQPVQEREPLRALEERYQRRGSIQLPLSSQPVLQRRSRHAALPREGSLALTRERRRIECRDLCDALLSLP